MVQLVTLLLMGSAVQSRRIPIDQLPCSPVTGISRDGNRWLVGGIRGLFIGNPRSGWKRATDQAVREMRTAKTGTWVLYGNGSLDKVEIKADRLYSDLLRGITKRPWVASFSFAGDNLLLGSEGGWMVRSDKGIDEHYPQALPAKPVTAISKVGSRIWLGTQDGIYIADKSIDRLGFASGLPDLWVTALTPSTDRSMVAGLASGGIVKIKDGKVEQIDTPSNRIRSLRRWHNTLVVGTLDGAWLRKGTTWDPICANEVTFLSQIGKELVVGTTDGVHFYRWQDS